MQERKSGQILQDRKVTCREAQSHNAGFSVAFHTSSMLAAVFRSELLVMKLYRRKLWSHRSADRGSSLQLSAAASAEARGVTWCVRQLVRPHLLLSNRRHCRHAPARPTACALFLRSLSGLSAPPPRFSRVYLLNV